MAPFNQSTGLQSETGYNPLMWSKPIENIKGSEAGRTSRQQVGQLGAGIADLFDKGQHEWLGQQIFKSAEPIREEWQQKFDNYRQELEDGNAELVPPSNTHQQTQTDVMTAPYTYSRTAGSIPDDVKKDLSSKLEAITGSGKNGKLRLTDYYARLDQLAQQFRNDWPGEREFIDDQFNKFSGRDIANKRLMATMQDINTYASAQREGMAQGVSFFNNEDVRAALGSNWDTLYTRFMNGDKTALVQADRMANPHLAALGQYKMDKAALETNKLKEETIANRSFKAVYNYAMSTSQSDLNNVVTGGQDISPVVEQAIKNPGQMVPGEQAVREAVRIQQAEQARMADLNKILDEPIAPGSKVRNRDTLTPDMQKKLFDDVHKIYTDQKNAFYEGNISLATMQAVLNKTTVEYAKAEAFKVFPPLLGGEVLANMPEPNKSQLMQQINAAFTKGGTEYAGQLASLFGAIVAGKTLPNGKDNPGPKAVIDSMQKDEAQGMAYGDGIRLGVSAASNKHSADSVINNTLDSITDNKTQGWLSKFALSHTDNISGMVVPGVDDLYSQVYNPQFIENSKRVGRLPELEKAAKRDLGGEIFKRTYDEIKDVPVVPWIKAHWDDQTHQIHFFVDQAEAEKFGQNATLGSGSEFGAAIPGVDTHLKDAERNFNMGLKVMSDIAKAKGDPNIDEFLAQAFKDAGADLTGMRMDNSYSNQFMLAWLHSRKKTEENKKSPQQEEMESYERSNEQLKGIQ